MTLQQEETPSLCVQPLSAIKELKRKARKTDRYRETSEPSRAAARQRDKKCVCVRVCVCARVCVCVGLGLGSLFRT